MLRVPTDFQGLREVSLFSGAGGGVLASKLLGWEAIAYVEYDKFPQKVLKARIEDGIIHDAPVFGDVREFDGKQFKGKADVVSGGFPCQPFSLAGKQAAQDDERNMWPETLRVISEIQPKIAFLENVPGLLSGSHGYFATILSDLADIGYECVWDCVPASAVEAPHRRDRLWILARPATLRDPATCAILPTFAYRGPEEVLPKRKGKPPAKVKVKDEGNGVFEMFSDEPEQTEPKPKPEPEVAKAEPKPEPKPLRGRRWFQPGVNQGDGGGAEPDWSRSGSLLLYTDGTVRVHRTPRLSFPEDKKSRYGHWPWPSLLMGESMPDTHEDGRKMWMTPNTFDGTTPKSQKALDHEAIHRKGRANPNNLRDQVNVDEGNAVWKGMWPTPRTAQASMYAEDAETLAARGRDGSDSLANAVVAAEATTDPSAPGRRMWATPTAGAAKEARPTEGMAARSARRGGPGNLIEDMAIELHGSEEQKASRQMWATPDASGSRKSARAMTASTDNGRRSGGGQSSPPGLEQQVELAEGIIPKELADVSLEELPENTRKMFPTPRANDWKGADLARDENRSGARHGGDDLATRVEKERLEGERAMWPTPNTLDGMAPRDPETVGDWNNEKDGRTGRKALANLRQAIHDPHYTEIHGEGEERSMWPTPRANKTSSENPETWQKRAERGDVSTPPLALAVEMVDDTRWDERQHWPTSRKGSLAEGSIAEDEAEGMFDGIGRGKGQKDPTKKPTAMLNPDWVELLMGWPQGWTNLNPMPRKEFDSWFTGTASHNSQVPSRYGPTTWANGSWEDATPRVTTEKKDRTARLKALGNGQVSLCAAAACVGLYETFRQMEERFQREVDGHGTDIENWIGL